MKFIIFNGSPAGANSNTNVIGEAFFSGAKKGGADTENVFLINKKIGHCKGCFTCWFQTPGKCVMQDDMPELLDKYDSADVVCLQSGDLVCQNTIEIREIFISILKKLFNLTYCCQIMCDKIIFK